MDELQNLCKDEGVEKKRNMYSEEDSNYKVCAFETPALKCFFEIILNSTRVTPECAYILGLEILSIRVIAWDGLIPSTQLLIFSYKTYTPNW